MKAHHGIVALAADKAGFLPVVRAAVLMGDDAVGKLEKSANGRSIEIASEVNPLATVARPGPAAIRDGDVRLKKQLLELGEMRAKHSVPSEL